MHLAYLMVHKPLSRKMPLLTAGMAATNAVPLILGTFTMLRYKENVAEVDALPSLVVAFKDEAGRPLGMGSANWKLREGGWAPR